MSLYIKIPNTPIVGHPTREEMLASLEMAWVIISNSRDWDTHEEWRAAAEKWRDEYFRLYDRSGEP